MDADLNIVEHVENIDRLSYPRLSGKEAFFKMNPYNGKTYSINVKNPKTTNISVPVSNGKKVTVKIRSGIKSGKTITLSAWSAGKKV